MAAAGDDSGTSPMDDTGFRYLYGSAWVCIRRLLPPQLLLHHLSSMFFQLSSMMLGRFSCRRMELAALDKQGHVNSTERCQSGNDLMMFLLSGAGPALFRKSHVGVQGAGLLVDRWQCAAPSSGVAKLGFRSQRKETRNPMETFTRCRAALSVQSQSVYHFVTTACAVGWLASCALALWASRLLCDTLWWSASG